MEKREFEKGFKQLDLTEQATFVLLGGINAFWRLAYNTFTAVAEASDSIADFSRPGASETLGAKSLEAIFNTPLKTDFIVRPRAETQAAASASVNVPVARPAAVPVKGAIPIKPVVIKPVTPAGSASTDAATT